MSTRRERRERRRRVRAWVRRNRSPRGTYRTWNDVFVETIARSRRRASRQVGISPPDGRYAPELARIAAGVNRAVRVLAEVFGRVMFNPSQDWPQVSRP